jgi:hypothetical protein
MGSLTEPQGTKKETFVQSLRFSTLRKLLAFAAVLTGAVESMETHRPWSLLATLLVAWVLWPTSGDILRGDTPEPKAKDQSFWFLNYQDGVIRILNFETGKVAVDQGELLGLLNIHQGTVLDLDQFLLVLRLAQEVVNRHNEAWGYPPSKYLA